MVMISRFNSKTEMPVPSKATLDGSFCDLKRKNTEENIMLDFLIHRYNQRALCSNSSVRREEASRPSAEFSNQDVNNWTGA